MHYGKCTKWRRSNITGEHSMCGIDRVCGGGVGGAYEKTHCERACAAIGITLYTCRGLSIIVLFQLN